MLIIQFDYINDRIDSSPKFYYESIDIFILQYYNVENKMQEWFKVNDGFCYEITEIEFDIKLDKQII